MTLKAVLFDLDGTLVDTSQDLANALNLTLKKHGRNTLEYNLIRPQVSNGARALIKLGFGDTIDNEQLELLRKELLSFYEDNIANFSTLFPGIQELLETLHKKNVKWGIVTNKPNVYTHQLMNKLALALPPDVIVCPDDVGVSKPDPKPLLHACKITSCEPENCIYIGDHKRDVECGHNANMPTIAVGYGFTVTRDEHLNWQATYCVNHAEEIWPLINREYFA